MKMNSFKTVDEYLSAQSPQVRKALESLRKQIKAAAPKAEEVLSYGIPAFKVHYMLVSYGAATKHCAFYVMSPVLMKHLKEELKPYDIATATIRFTPDKPLPPALIKKIVQARTIENEERHTMRELKKPLKKAVKKSVPKKKTPIKK